VGAFEQAKGKAKETIGNLTDNADLVHEGEAQQVKGEAEAAATESRLEAKAHEAKANVAEKVEESAQHAK
jgi:uncharacterized protein YjbJ (UPF0337 family)